MRQALLRTSMLIGAGALAGLTVDPCGAQASDGIKLEVGGFFSSVYVGVIDGKHDSRHWGNERSHDGFKHDAEVHFKGEAQLDNGLTVEARIELEGENDDDQIDKSWVGVSGDFGSVRIGAQDDALEAQCIGAPGGTANFSAFSPTGWASNDPIGSNSYCFSADNDSQKISYLTPTFSGFQLAISYTPSANAEDYTQQGVNNAGTPSNPEGTAHHIVSTYLTYTYEGEDWSVNLGGGGSWQLARNNAADTDDGRNSAYQTGATLTVGSISAGAVFQYFDQGGRDNDIWIAGAGLAYSATDALTFGLQYSHGRYDGDFKGDGFGTDGGHNLNRVVTTVTYALAPGIDLDADVGFTWYRDTRDATPAGLNDYQAAEIGVGTSLTF
jgi:predicted porin